MRVLLSDAKRPDRLKTDRKANSGFDSGLQPSESTVPLLLTLSLPSNARTERATEAAGIALRNIPSCTLIGLSRQTRQKQYPVELQCDPGRHSDLRPRRWRHGTTESSSRRILASLPHKIERFLSSCVSAFFKVYVVSAVAMFLGHFLTYRSERSRSELLRRFVNRHAAAERVGIRLLPFIRDQDLVDYQTAQQWQNVRTSFDFARQNDAGTGAGFLVAGGGLLGVNVSAEAFLLALLLYVLNTPLIRLAEWNKNRRREKKLRNLERVAVERNLPAQRSANCRSSRVVLVFLVDLERFLVHNE